MGKTLTEQEKEIIQEMCKKLNKEFGIKCGDDELTIRFSMKKKLITVALSITDIDIID